jgi:hypothetical protein
LCGISINVLPDFDGRQIGFRPCLAHASLDTKFFDIRIEHEPFARDQRNAQEISISFERFPRHALDKGMVFEDGGPNGREISSLAHQVGAMAREIARSLLGHFNRPRYLDVRGQSIRWRSRRVVDLQFAIICAIRNKREYFL